MKTRITALAIALTVMFIACTKDDNNSNGTITTTTVNSTVTTGTWRVTNFSEDGTDETAHFNGYAFTFAAGGVLTASNGISNVAGTWNTGTDDSKVKFVIVILSPSGFEDLSEDWQVIERTDTRIKLQHISGGNGGTDLLTFERN